MGGGFAVLPIVLANSPQHPQVSKVFIKSQSELVRQCTLKAAPMHEKLLEETRKEKTEKVQPVGNSKEKPTNKDKSLKQSKLAERLRRSFRRREHRSLEIKRCEHPPDDLQTNKLDNNNLISRLPLSIASQLQLPDLGLGGHINSALLLDSPDECTPPEYAYQHLSSVATTNTTSNSSLESSCELSEQKGPQANIFHWPCPQTSEMGGEISTARNDTQQQQQHQQPQHQQFPKRRNEASSSQGQGGSRNEQQTTGSASAGANANASRSCSLTSESSSARITRLQNFLFKSSNESSRSFQGHSNDGFTASSYNSSSGEWEQLGAHGVSSSSGIAAAHDLNAGSLPEESPMDEIHADAQLPVESTEAGAYYQYTLTSPNNPFLPEITARTYRSNYEGEDQHPEDLQLDCNVTSVKYTGWSAGSRSAQLPTPAYSRAVSQESTYSESGANYPPAPTPSSASSSSSTPGRHRRKLFSLNSPTRLLHHQQVNPTSGAQQHQALKAELSASPTESLGALVLGRSLNPFLSNSTSPVAVPVDLRSKRDEFLHATMKICLVVSPPASKLQLKSKSLTHLDGLDSLASCHHGVATSTATAGDSSFISQGAPIPAPAPASPGQQMHPVTSSEYFSVSFCLESSACPEEEFIPATKGITLMNAIRQALQRRNLSFSQLTIIDNNYTSNSLDTGPGKLTGQLDGHIHVETLAGHHLVVTERDSSRKTLQKAASFGSRQRPGLLSSASTEETSETTVVAGKHVKQRWSSLFGIKNPQQNQLYELLNNYAKNGVPQRQDALSFDHPTLSESLSYLHNMDKSWRDIVESSSMSESEIKIQTAIWELVTTEVYYIHALQTVTDLFLACLEAVQEERLLIEVDQHRLFSNVRSVCEANIKFWTLWLYPMVAHSIRTREPLRFAFFQEGFITFASIFSPYKVYCAEQSTCQFYCKELNQNNSLFTAYLAWCESQKMCNRLRLADIVVRPMQRLTKYSLLLAAIRKHMSDVDEIEVMDIMVHSVENFVGSVNNHLTMRQEGERLKGVMARIESYDVIDTSNDVLEKLIKQHSQMFDLCAPMRGCPTYQVRHLFMEGDHKFKDNIGKADVHCFLLTDILLVCKSIAKKGLGTLKVIRQPYLTDHLIVHLTQNNTLNCVYLNEFQVATTAFTLQCMEAKNWYDALWRAKTIYQRLKRGIGGNGDSFRYGGSNASGNSGDALSVRKSPINSSICSHVSSGNNSHSGSVEWNDSRNISVDFEKTNSQSSDEGSGLMVNHGQPSKCKQQLFGAIPKPNIGRIASTSANTLSVQPVNHLGQSLPNLSMQHIQTNNTLLVPGTTTSHSGNLLLSPCHRGISYPPPSPTRVPLKRGMAFSTSTKNPPLLKTRNVTSQNSINWHQIPATPTPPSPRPQHNSHSNVAHVNLQSSLPAPLPNENQLGTNAPPPLLQKQLSHRTAKLNPTDLQRQLNSETDV